jgi:hypothetical protein
MCVLVAVSVYLVCVYSCVVFCGGNWNQMLLILSPLEYIQQSRIQKRSMFDFRDYFGSGSSPGPLRFRNLGSNLKFQKKACFLLYDT